MIVLKKLKLLGKKINLAPVTFLLIFCISVFAFYNLTEQNKKNRELEFEFKTDQIKSLLEYRLGHYIQILKGAQGLVYASDSVSRKDWKTYVNALEVDKHYPGIQGIGYCIFLSPAEVPVFEKRIRENGYPDFSIRTDSGNAVYSTVIYLEPFKGRNLRAFGYDMFSNPVRKKAMERARDTGLPTITHKVRLIQETGVDQQAGFLIYLPVYKTHSTPKTIAERRQNIKGFVYNPFRAKDLILAVLRGEFKDIDIEVYDGDEIKPEVLLFDKNPEISFFDKDNTGLGRVKTLNLYGNKWQLYFAPRPAFFTNSDKYLPYVVLISGILVGLLIFFFMQSYSRSRKSNKLKQEITDNATAALFMLDAKGYCTFMNPAAEKMTGYTFEESRHTLLHNLIHYLHPDGKAYAVEDCPIENALLKKQYLKAHEDLFIRKDGTFFNVQCNARPMFDDGESMGILLEVRDISKEKEAIRALSESEERFRLMADSAPVAIWITDENMEFTYVNHQWLHFTGQTIEESIGDNWLKALHPDDEQLARGKFEEAHENLKPFRINYRLRRFDGRYRWVAVTATPRFDNNYRFAGYIGSVIDITDHIEAEQKIRENAALLQKIFMEVPALVSLIDARSLEYTLVNDLYSDIYDNIPLLGNRIDEVHPGKSGQDFLRRLNQVIKTGKSYTGNEIESTVGDMTGPGSHTGYFNVVYQPLINKEEQVYAIMIFAIEVTELVTSRQRLASLNNELSNKNTELVRTNNDLDNFVYTASHDLKSPIANLEGLTYFMKDSLSTKLDEDEKQLLDMVNISVNKLKQTISDLSDITKVQKDIGKDKEELSFLDVINSLKDEMALLLPLSDFDLNLDLQVESIPYARRNLRSILYNLLSNAIKYRSSNRRLQINITSTDSPEFIILKVQDNGLGIKQNYLTKLFSMFTRLHSHVEGSGIGLYMIKRTIENNGGKIEVDSILDSGTTFTVYFKK